MIESTKINEELVNKIASKYQQQSLDCPNEYAIFFAKTKKSTITIFKSKNDKYSLTIGSPSKKEIVSIMKAFKITDYEINGEEVYKEVFSNIKGFAFVDDQIGSDEVGTGDFFGPITVVAALVKKEEVSRLIQLGIKDSKKLTDAKIREIAKVAIKEFKYSSLSLDNKKYNELIAKGFNMNKIKVFLHNRALSNLHKKYPKIKNIYVDKFTEEENYYKYLADQKDVLKGIYFHIKGETYFPSVALASVIARYSFLEKMDEISKKYNTKIPFGAGKIVDAFAKEFIKKHGIKELDKIAKKNFVTYEKLLK